MVLNGFLKPWSSRADRPIPAESPFGPLDLRFAGRGRNNRWNRAGERTLYLASDRGVIVGEFARHVRHDRAPAGEAQVVERRIYEMRARVDFALDLRDPTLCDILSLTNAPACFLDRDIARAVSGYARYATPAQALIVPSMAFLDQPERWILVLFLEKLPADPTVYLSSLSPVGTVSFAP